jgi:hypothetical protein
VLYEDILDVCIDNRRTIIARTPTLRGDRLFLFADHTEVEFEGVEVRPLA